VCVRPQESFIFWSGDPFFLRVWNVWPVTLEQAAVFTDAAESAMSSSGWHETHAALDIMSEDWDLMELSGERLRKQARDLVLTMHGEPILQAVVDKVVEIAEAGGLDGIFDFRMPLRPEHEEIWRRLLRQSRKNTARAVDLAEEIHGSYSAYRELGASPWG
jgi:hypothetical protein